MMMFKHNYLKSMHNKKLFITLALSDINKMISCHNFATKRLTQQKIHIDEKQNKNLKGWKLTV